MSNDVRFDWQRAERTRVPEVVLAEHKSTEQLVALASRCVQQEKKVFMTRVSEAQADALRKSLPGQVHVHSESQTVYVSDEPLALNAEQGIRIAIVAAGTSDVPVVAEIEQTLLFLGEGSMRYVDVGVAGLWRLTELAEELSDYSVIIAVAGMEGALFSVLAGLVPAPVIAVPVSVGYGVASGGNVALHSALSSCAPGIAVVNIDNGFGAAALAAKMLGIFQQRV